MHLPDDVVKALCKNSSGLQHPTPSFNFNDDSVTPTSANYSLSTEENISETDRHALLYIVVVLLFYSLGIIIAIIMYLKREKDEIVEDKAYEDYMTFRSDPDAYARYFRVQRMLEHLDVVKRTREDRIQQEERVELATEEARRKEEKRLRDDQKKILVIHPDCEAVEPGNVTLLQSSYSDPGTLTVRNPPALSDRRASSTVCHMGTVRLSVSPITDQPSMTLLAQA